MIHLGSSTVFVVYEDGSSAPFDSAELQSRLIGVCLDSGAADASVAQDVALSVEFALSRKFRDLDSASIKASEVDALVERILEDIGYAAVAGVYRKSCMEHNQAAVFHLSELEQLIGSELNLSGDLLKSVAARVQNTLISIGADHPSPALPLELARHFRETAISGIKLKMEIPDFDSQPGVKSISAEQLTERLDEAVKQDIRARSLILHPINLKIFPHLHIGIRLTGLVAGEQLSAPLTELALAPLFCRTATRIDAICAAGDALCRERRFEDAIPLKLLLDFTDASLFVREWMDRRQPGTFEKAIAEVAESLSAQLNRTPFKIICK